MPPDLITKSIDIPINPPVSNKFEIAILAIKRSGQHAIIEWMMKNHKGSYYFLNNVKPEKPLLPEPEDFPKLGFRGSKGVGVDRYNIQEKLASTPVDMLIFNYEGTPPQVVVSSSSYKNRQSEIGRSRKIKTVISLRNPMNNFASLIKRHMNIYGSADRINNTINKYTKIWTKYAKEYFGHTNYFKKKISLSYDLWVEDLKYRKQLAVKLKLSGHKKIKHVPSYGGGSSFDKKDPSVAQKGNQEALFYRWKAYEHDDNFIAFFKEDILVELAIEYFQSIGKEAEFGPEVKKLWKKAQRL